MATRDWRQEFEQVALTHLDSLFHMALRHCRNRADAEDLGEETYLKAFTHFDQFASGTNCRAWLFAILHNTFVNRLKREGRREIAQICGVPVGTVMSRLFRARRRLRRALAPAHWNSCLEAE